MKYFLKMYIEFIDKTQKIVYNISYFRGYGSVGRAVRSQRTGHEFESRYLHQTRQSLNTKKKIQYIFVSGVAGFVIEKGKSNA